VTTDQQLSRFVGRALNFGFFETRDCSAASMNGKMSEYHAAVGLAELDGWGLKCEAWHRVASAYRRRLNAVGLGDRLVAAPTVAGCYVLFRCTHADEARRLLRSLASANIESRFWYGHGLQRQPYYAAVLRDDLAVTERIAPLVLGLPVAPDLAEASITRVVTAISEAVL
jgi:dTDP-4-amino-4,6-dideoxygalactose transaminase